MLGTPTPSTRPKKRSLLSQAVGSPNTPISHLSQTQSPLRSSSSSSSSSSSQTSAFFSPSPPTAATHQTPTRRPIFQPPTPASLTRGGSTVPFDFEASRRAARLALASPKVGQRESVGAPGGTGRPKRFVRKRALVDRIQDIPHDILNRLQSYSPDFVRAARPVGLFLTVLQFLLRAPLFSAAQKKKRNILRSGAGGDRPLGGRYDDEFELGSGKWGWGHWSAWLSILFLLVAGLNTMYLFTRTRSYRMHLRTDPLSSPNAKAVEEDEVMEDPEGLDSLKHLSLTSIQFYQCGLWWMLRHLNPIPLLRFLVSLPAASDTDKHQSQRRRRMVQQLDIWSPPDFNLQFFSTYTPPSSLLLHLITPYAPFSALLSAFATNFMIYLLVARYAELVKDREVVYAEVMREYDQRVSPS